MNASALAAWGWHVFPIRPGDKRPAIPEWEQRASNDPGHVTRHWPSPHHNAGIACGPSRLVVIDCDTDKHGRGMPPGWQIHGVHHGADAFAHLLEQHGQGWPETYIVHTPSGGTHFYYQAPPGREIRNSAGKVAPMIDVRAAGGYVVGAGSVTSAGAYELIDDTSPAPLPAWLADLAAPPKPDRPAVPPRPVSTGTGRGRSRFVALLDTILAAPRGQRNNVLHWAACRAADMIRDGGIGRQAAYTALAQAGEAIGLGDREVQATIGSAFGKTV